MKLAIQGYDLKSQHIPGRLNVVADNMSRLCDKEPHETGTSSEFVFALCLLHGEDDDTEGESKLPLTALCAPLSSSDEHETIVNHTSEKEATAAPAMHADTAPRRKRKRSQERVPLSEE